MYRSGMSRGRGSSRSAYYSAQQHNQNGQTRGTTTSALEDARQVVLQLSTHVKDPDTKDCRIYVGNLNSRTVRREHIYMEFSRFGEIVAIGRIVSQPQSASYVFVQYSCEESAREAVIQMDGMYFHGETLEVRSVELRTDHGEHPRLYYNNADSEPLPAGNQTVEVAQIRGSHGSKRPSAPSATSNDYPQAKKIRTGPDNGRSKIPDILVCGNCHQHFSDIEIMINHRRKPCKSKVQCHCKTENIPDLLACAICYGEFPSPWKLMEHIHRIHQLRICNNITALGQADNDILTNGNVANQEDQANELNEEDYLDLDNDLMEDDEVPE